MRLVAPHGGAASFCLQGGRYHQRVAQAQSSETVETALRMVEHTMPLLPPAEYEPALRRWAEPNGTIIRWYIARVDEAAASVTVEVVMRPHGHEQSH